MKLKLLLLTVSLALFSSLSSFSSEAPKRKKVVGPPSSGDSNLPWNRPRSWEGTARYGPMMPQSR